MSKRKTLIELQAKPENKAVRQLIEKTKPVGYAPINLPKPAQNLLGSASLPDNNEREDLRIADEISAAENSDGPNEIAETIESDEPKEKSVAKPREKQAAQKKTELNAAPNETAATTKTAAGNAERLRIFQTSTPVTRTITKFQKAAIVVRSGDGKQLVELLWRDQMNEKTRDIWDVLVEKFGQAEDAILPEVSLKKREILEISGVKSDRTFINAVYTLEDMGLIEVKRLSGNKEGNIYVLTDEGREEIGSYPKPS